MKKIKVKMNKPVYLSLSILEISKTLMCEFWYDYIKLCYVNTNSFDTSNYVVDIPLPTGKNKKNER